MVSFYDYVNSLKTFKNFSEIAEKFFLNIKDAANDKGCQFLVEQLKSFDGQEDVTTLKDILNDFEVQIESGELEEKNKKELKEVRVMTMHSSKGCEAPIVFIPALEDDIIPGERVTNIEEKRRLFYVSLTRAKVGLFLTWANQRTGQEIHSHGRRMLDKKRSSFLDEML